MHVRRAASMEVVGVILVVIAVIITVHCEPEPGDHHHVRHRIHVPQKIKTIYHTKIVKVPEHHHYFHEKEKIITVPVKKEHHHEISYGHEESDWEGSNAFEDDDHGVFKKHAPHSNYHKASASQKKSVRTPLPKASYAKTVPGTGQTKRPHSKPTRGRGKPSGSVRPSRESIEARNEKGKRSGSSVRPSRESIEVRKEHAKRPSSSTRPRRKQKRTNEDEETEE